MGVGQLEAEYTIDDLQEERYEAGEGMEDRCERELETQPLSDQAA